MLTSKQSVVKFATQVVTHQPSLDFPRWSTFAGTVLLGSSAVIAILITYFSNIESDFRDLLLLSLIVVFKSILLATVIRLLDSIPWSIVGFVLLVTLMILIIWNETYDVTRTTFPVLREFPYVSSSKVSILDIVALVAIVTAIVPSIVRVNRLKAVYHGVVRLWFKLRRNPARIVALAGCLAWPGQGYSVMVYAFDLFIISDHYDFIDFIGFVYEVNYLHGAHVYYLEGIVIYVIFNLVSSITSSRLRRNLGLLVFCFGVIVTYLISFRWPFEVLPGLASPDYGPLLWSIPALVLLLASAIAKMFSALERDDSSHKSLSADPILATKHS